MLTTGETQSRKYKKKYKKRTAEYYWKNITAVHNLHVYKRFRRNECFPLSHVMMGDDDMTHTRSHVAAHKINA